MILQVDSICCGTRWLCDLAGTVILSCPRTRDPGTPLRVVHGDDETTLGVVVGDAGGQREEMRLLGKGACPTRALTSRLVAGHGSARSPY